MVARVPWTISIVALAVAATIATGAPLSYVPASGYAMRFDGSADRRTYLEVTPKCGSGVNDAPFRADNVTVSAWVRTSFVSVGDSFVAGYPFNQGPFLNVDRNGMFNNPSAREVTDSSSVCTTLVSNPVVRDGQWHHLAYAASLTQSAYFLDGVLIKSCTGRFSPPSGGALLHVGAFDPTAANGANDQSFTGDIDDVRIYKVAILDAPGMQGVLAQAPSQADLDAGRLLLWLHFDDGTVVDYSGTGNPISAGGGLVIRSPTPVVSGARTIGPYGLLLVQGRQDATSALAPNLTFPMVVDQGQVAAASRQASITINQMQSASGSGRLLINGRAVAAGSVVAGPNLTLTFVQKLGATGDAIATLNATVNVTSAGGAATWTQRVRVQVGVRANSRPVAGGPGQAVWFDGQKHFYMADRLRWPIKNATYTDQNTGKVVTATGLSAITIEFWAAPVAGDAHGGALITLNGNGEMDADWVQTFGPPARRTGRWLVALPGETHALTWYTGTTIWTTPVKQYYTGWAHYALVHDGIEGTSASVYINGQLVSSYAHNHDGMKGARLDGYNHILVGCWSFWSEVYHRGIIDDLRLWNRSRSGDEIRRDMYRQMRGNEADLFAYWTFNDDAGGVVADETGRGNDLHAGGCVPCEPRFYSMAQNADWTKLGPQDCLPSAQAEQSMYFRAQTRFGGTHCFVGEERADTRPVLQASGAPIGGYVFDAVGAVGAPVPITLNGTDPDADPLTYWILALPDHGTLQYYANATWTTVQAVPAQATRTVRLQSAALDGGHPYTTVVYAVDDGWSRSDPIAVNVDLGCPAGYYLDQGARRCRTCPPGSYSDATTLATSCTACPANTAQGNPGQTSCVPCVAGKSYALQAGAASCTLCPTDIVASPTSINVSRTICAVDLHLANDVAVDAAAPVVVVDFRAMLPAGLAPGAARVTVFNVPKYSDLVQLAGNGTALDDFADYFVAPVALTRQYVARVVSVTAALGARPASALVGQPDAGSGSSPNAYAPCDANNNNANVTVAFATPVYLTAVHIYENTGGGAVSRIEALRPDTGAFVTIWSGTPLGVGLSSARDFQPPICPTTFPTDTLRLTVDAIATDGRNEIDAIMVEGSADLKSTGRALVQNADLKVALRPATLPSLGSGASLGYRYTDSIRYEIRDCAGFNVVAQGVQDVSTTLGATVVTPIVDVRAGSASIITSVVLAALGVVLCVASIGVLHVYRAQPIIKASSVFFMSMMLIGMVLGFVNVLLIAVQEANYDNLPGFCAVRPFLFTAAFVTVMGALIVKTARIVWIFEVNAAKGKVTTLSNARMSAYVALMLAVDLLNDVIWTAVDRPTDQTFLDGTHRYRMCSGRTSAYNVFTAISIALKGILTVIGLVLTAKARNVPSTFNEAKALSFITYSVASQAVIYLVLSGIVNGNADATLIVATFATCFALFSSWVILIGYKIYVVLYRPDVNVYVTKNSGGRPNNDGFDTKKTTSGHKPSVTSTNADVARKPSVTAAAGAI